MEHGEFDVTSSGTRHGICNALAGSTPLNFLAVLNTRVYDHVGFYQNFNYIPVQNSDIYRYTEIQREILQTLWALWKIRWKQKAKNT